MTESATYNVILSGNLLSGFETGTVVDAFAKMFKLPPEKARAMVGTRVVIKKEVELSVAKSYQQKLSAIGIDVKLEKHGDVGEQSLAPIQDDPVDGERGEPGAGLPGSEHMVCPKCKFKQDRADECIQCGVFIHKVIKQAAEAQAAGLPQTPTEIEQPEAQQRLAAHKTTAKTKPSGAKRFVAPLLLAVLAGALCYAIALVFI